MISSCYHQCLSLSILRRCLLELALASRDCLYSLTCSVYLLLRKTSTLRAVLPASLLPVSCTFHVHSELIMSIVCAARRHDWWSGFILSPFQLNQVTWLRSPFSALSFYSAGFPRCRDKIALEYFLISGLCQPGNIHTVTLPHSSGEAFVSGDIWQVFLLQCLPGTLLWYRLWCFSLSRHARSLSREVPLPM